MLMLPAVPAAPSPVLIITEPLLPPVVDPVLKVKEPLTPFVPAFAVRMLKAPLHAIQWAAGNSSQDTREMETVKVEEV